jgi:hypothetical protein
MSVRGGPPGGTGREPTPASVRRLQRMERRRVDPRLANPCGHNARRRRALTNSDQQRADSKTLSVALAVAPPCVRTAQPVAAAVLGPCIRAR